MVCSISKRADWISTELKLNQRNKDMEYAVFANGTFWGIWAAESKEEACQKAADEVGTEGNTEGLRSFPVTADQIAEVEAWHEAGADAANVPGCAAH